MKLKECFEKVGKKFPFTVHQANPSEPTKKVTWEIQAHGSKPGEFAGIVLDQCGTNWFLGASCDYVGSWEHCTYTLLSTYEIRDGMRINTTPTTAAPKPCTKELCPLGHQGIHEPGCEFKTGGWEASFYSSGAQEEHFTFTVGDSKPRSGVSAANEATRLAEQAKESSSVGFYGSHYLDALKYMLPNKSWQDKYLGVFPEDEDEEI